MTDSGILNDRYQLEEPLGRGGMAVVYRARDLMLERVVAIKVLRRQFSSEPEFRERFKREAKAAANLSHPNIVTIYDFFLDSDQLFIVMEFVPGDDLKSMQKMKGRFSINNAVDLIIQACNGIGYAHRAGLVHCDVKPQNMLITPDNRLKVVDFGIARALSSISPDERAEVVWGSPQYYSPEQAAGVAPSPASDVYSLGVVLYEMLTGQLPFKADSSDELARLHQEEPPIPPSTLNPNIPVGLEQIVLKVLYKEPSARYRTADQLGRVLDNFRKQPPGRPSAGISVISPAASVITNNQLSSSDQAPNTPSPSVITYSQSSLKPISKFDWITWLLVLVALIALGGLIPFWLWVYYIIRPPI